MLSTGVTDPFNLVMEKVLSPTVAICNGRETILLGTYNYMGMTFDPDVIQAGKDALDNFGSGTTGSRVLNGTYAGHKACEEALRDFYDMDGAMVFSTGYLANLGVISTLAGKDDYIILDIDSHASIYDGCAMGNANVIPFRHNDIEALEKRLKRLPEDAGKLVILEGVYSMLGDVAPLDKMVPLAKKYGAMVLVDEAHSMGFIGENGRGVCEAQGVIDDVDFIIGTFSKSVGTVGGFCVSNHPKFEILRLVSRPYVFTASLPPSVVATAATSIGKLKHAKAKRDHLWENSKRLHGGLKKLGFQLGTEDPQSAIIAVIMPDLEKGAAMWEALLNEGLYVNLARPPATPANMTLLRCSLCALHSDEQVGEILGMFERAGRATGCID
nr:aminotransferase class I/II-fold pyridoxal phosphate-dependent enzyme [Sphingomicrobium lutaoense]